MAARRESKIFLNIVDAAATEENKSDAENKRNNYPKNFIKLISKSGTEDTHYSIFSENLQEEIKLNTLSDLNETEESKKHGIRELKGHLKENDLKCPDVNVIVAVLRNCKYDIPKSKVKLEKFLKIRQMVGTKLSRMDFKTIESLFDKMPFGLLPYRDKYGRVVLFTRSFPQVDQYETEFIAICATAILLFTMSLPMTSAVGIAYIDECKYSSVYEYYTTLKYFRRLLGCLFDIPLRIRRADIVNEHFVCRWFYNAIRPVLPQKLTERVSFLGSGYKKLQKVYHPNLLPEEFGGTLGQMNDSFYRERLLDFMRKLRDENEYIIY